MAWYRAGGGGIPSAIKTDMNAVLNKKFGTSTDYPPTDWAPTVNLLGPLPEKTASGSVAAITDGADGVPVKNWGVTVDATLSGVSSVVCTQAGKNLLAKDIVRYSNSLATLSECFAIHHGTYTVTIGTVANANNWRLSVLLMDDEGNALTDNAYKPSNDLQLATNRWRFGSNTTTKVFTVTIVTDCYIRFFIELGDTSSSTTITDSYLESGSTSTTYTPYAAPTVSTVPLGRTIYGGSVDVVNGTGEEEYIKVTFDGSDDEGWAKTNAGPYYSTITGYYKEQGFINGICDSFTMVAEVGLASNMTTDLTCSFYFGNDQNRFYIRYDAMANAAALKAWLSENPVTVVYKVATATPFTFTPITPTPETELGVNNFWADEGDSAVTYRADIDLLLGGN